MIEPQNRLEEAQQGREAEALADELREVIKKRHGDLVSGAEINIILTALSDLSGFYLAPCDPKGLSKFAEAVCVRYALYKIMGAATKVDRKTN